MCNNRKEIYTNAHKLFYNRYQQYQMTIPCGECTECRIDKANEWKVRTYYQYLDCIEKGGYVLWDGLSYKNENIPHLNDIEKHVPDKLNFKCFNRADTQKFFKRLRKNIQRKGHKGEIKYMLAGEYGQEEDYTLRPHYHLILYSYSDITPIELSYEIDRAWGLGRTNGIMYKGRKYFYEKGLINSKASALRVAKYIGKYCLKNQEYDKVADAKIKELCKFWYLVENTQGLMDIDLTKYKDIDNEIFKSPKWKKTKKEILRKIKSYHVQSKGYGEGAICRDGVIKNNLIGMPNTQKIYWWQKLPMYYIRKIYYNIKKINGKYIWTLNNIGIEWKKKNITKTIENYAKKLEEKQRYCQSEEFRKDILEYWNEEKKKNEDSPWYRLNDLLYAYRNGRTWKEYAGYIIYQKGRIINDKILNPEEIIDLNKKASIDAEYASENELIYNYCHEKDIENFGHQIVANTNLGDFKNGYKKTKGTELRPKEFAKRYCINENTLYKWNDFDKLKDTLDTIDFYIEWGKNKHQRIKEKNEKLKALGFYKLC